MKARRVTLMDIVKEYVEQLGDGADPVEALSGHLCGPGCWHWDTMSDERKRELLRAPWNQKRRKVG